MDAASNSGTAWNLMRDRIQRNQSFLPIGGAGGCFIELHCPLQGLTGTAAQVLDSLRL